MPDKSTFPQAKAAAAALVESAVALDAMITKDAREVQATGIAQYAASETKDGLDKAQRLLAKDHYKLCFAGGFSAGKSTTINALLGEPDLLPTAAGECTLSITIMTGPLGGRELVRVKYFPRDLAVKQVVFHQKRYRNAFKQFDTEARHANADQQVEIVRKTIAWLGKAHGDETLSDALRKEFDKGKAPKYIAELEEFLMYLDKFRDRLGNIHEDTLANVKVYLTYDDKQGGLGHLFLVDQVIIHKKNVLFEEKGIQIIDLPGIDSTNAYARQVTMGYLQEADLVVNVLPPQGFTMSYIDIINEMSEANRGNIANKMFYVINRFDANEAKDFRKKELESLLRDQIAAEIDKNGLNSSNLFATCAILDIEKLRGRGDRYQAMLAANATKVAEMAGVSEPWNAIARDALEGRGIDKVRAAILTYLENQLAFERLRDVRLSAKRTLDAAALLLQQNAALVAAARANASTKIQRIREFVEKTNQQAEMHLVALATPLPGMIGNVVQGQLKTQIVTQVAQFSKIPLADPAKQIAFTGSAARLQTPAGIKQHWIDWVKIYLCDRFVDLTMQTLTGNVQGLIDQQIKQAKLDAILELLGKQSGADLAGPVRQAIATARQNIEIITRLRANEETWTLRDQPITPQGFDPAWTPQIEEAFKADITGNFTKILSGFADRLAAVLGKHYQVIIANLVQALKDRTDDLERALMAQDVLELPTDLIIGETPDPDALKKARLLAYAIAHERLAVQDKSLAAQLA